MSYIRTEEIKNKQRATMLQKTLEYNWDEIAEKRRQTIKEKGVKVGRKKGEGPEKRGWFKPCKVCGKEIYVTQYTVNRKKYCCKECMHSDDDYINKLRNMDKSYMRTENYSRSRGNFKPEEFKSFKQRVFTLTEYNYAVHILEINPNNLPRTLAGVHGGYQLDHIISIKHGFNIGMTPEEIACKDNLQMLPWRDNLLKGTKCL